MPNPSKKLRDKAEELETCRDERQRLQTEEMDLESVLAEMMASEKVPRFAIGSGRLCDLALPKKGKAKVKFTTPKGK